MNLLVWQNFAVASVGIAGALAGLIFVGVSLNMDFVLEHSHLTARGGVALATLVGIALMNLCLLVPGQTPHRLAVETLVLAVVLVVMAVQTCRITLRRRGPGDPLSWAYQPLATNLLPPVAMLVAALRVLVAHDPQVYALATAAGLATAVWEAWVLLIEIRR